VRLKDIPKDSKIFIDASIFLAVALKRPKRFVKPCEDFLARVDNKAVEPYISNLILDEVLYKLIQVEIAKQHGLHLHKVADYRKQNPTCVSQLTECWKAIDAILSSGARVLPLSFAFKDVMQSCKHYHLLTRDAMHVQTMKNHGLATLASTDSDFKRVPGIKLCMP
jgi:predicted nucleic acid-binding protein